MRKSKLEKIKEKEEKRLLKEENKRRKQEEKIARKEEKEKAKEEKKLRKQIEKGILPTNYTKFYPEGVKFDLEYPKNTMVGYLLESVARYPDHIAIEYYGRTYKYREFYEMIRDTAKSLKSQGVKEGDRIAICMPNTPQAVMMFYAANMVGAIAALIHPLSAENEIESYINESNATFLLTLDLVYDKIHNIVDKTCVTKIVVASVGESLKNIKKFLYKFKSRGTVPKIELTDDIMTWKEFLNYGYDYDGEIACLKDSEDAAVILYSGGTSGNPKGILLSNFNFNALALSCHMMIEQSGPGESILAILPIFHGFGLGVCIHTPLCAGMRVVLVPNFSPKDFAKLLSKHKISIACAVPSLFESMTKMKLGKNDLSNFKCAISGGDFMSKDLKDRVDKYLQDHGSSAEVRVGYGLTEASAATCVTPTGNYREGSIGIPFPGTYYKIVKVGTHEMANFGEDGEVCISGPTVMMGYLNNPDETKNVLRKHKDGKLWLHTGDIGYISLNGIVYYTTIILFNL